LRPRQAEQHVYVTAKQTYLRDRVAAVSNRTGTVENGEALEVLDHARKFFKVKSPKGEVGWIQDTQVATQEVFEEFQALGAAHKAAPAVASAVAHDEVNLHLRPGATTETFYRLPEGAKFQLLQRATLPKAVAPGAQPAKAALALGKHPSVLGPPTPPMEDWWLVRDQQGRTGWLRSRSLDVDAPESLTRYAEGQRFIGAYVLTTVHDAEAEQENKDIPVYLTVLAPLSAGLPYDFDQVRLFTWNIKKHRYETGFRDKNIEGYLPVAIRAEKNPYGQDATAQTPLPTFTYKVLSADAPPVVPDPATGLMTPGKLIAKTYRVEGNATRRVQAPGSHDEPEARPVKEEKKDKKGKKK
jgi:SH3-like domain-containing protein